MKKQNILFGTFILTTASLLSRVFGFFLRIFMSRTFGEEQIGLYQLIFPIYALCISITSAGIELALSRCVAKEISLGQKKRAQFFLYISLILSLSLSCIIAVIIPPNATFLSIYVLGDLRCEQLLSILVYALPFASIHSCICGYYLGSHYANVYAYSQLIEQFFRVGSIFLLCKFYSSNIIYAVYGIVISEAVSSLFCLNYFLRKESFHKDSSLQFRIIPMCTELFSLAGPITLNKLLTNLLHSAESISIPLSLQAYGYSNSEALSSLGVLTGMALPCVFFPSAISNSIATLMLPTVAELQSSHNTLRLRKIVQKTVLLCVCLGSVSCLLFFLFSNFIGNRIFHSPLVTSYLKVLCWICPFLYTNSTLASVINGLGKTSVTFWISFICILLRIGSITLLIPSIGIKGYLFGLLFSQLLSFLLHLLYILYTLQNKTIEVAA